jgi:hypothetical protein
MATRGFDFKTAYYRSLFALAAAFVSAIDAPLLIRGMPQKEPNPAAEMLSLA